MSCGDPASLYLLELSLHTEVLGLLGPLEGDPLQQPLVGLVSARHLQRCHIVPPEHYQPQLIGRKK